MAIKLTLVNQFDGNTPDAIVFDTTISNLLAIKTVDAGNFNSTNHITKQISIVGAVLVDKI